MESPSAPAAVSARAMRRDRLLPWLTHALVLVAVLVLYRDVMAKLVVAWQTDENYSHGFLIVPMALYLAWERRGVLAAAPARPSLAGLALVFASLGVLGAGTLGAELFLTRVSLLGVLAGAVLWLFGWQHLRALAFPIGFLLLMIPIPAILFNQVAFPLQLLASRFGEAALGAFGIPVLREGNVITLSHMTLEVVEACAGIRSLVSLLTLAIVYGYVMEQRTWVRVAVALSAIPVAIVANGVRVAGTGIAAHVWGPEGAEGFFHSFSGWAIFLVATALLVGVHRVLTWGQVLNRKAFRDPTPGAGREEHRDSRPDPHSTPLARAVLLSLLLIASAVFIARASTPEAAPPARHLAAFPLEVADWRGEPTERFDQQTMTVLGVDEYINRIYLSPLGGVGLYVGYYRSQQQGDAIHSPLNCLPGAGWQPVKRERIRIAVRDATPGGGTREIEVNRLLVEKGLDRQVVLYWYQSHGRVVASEYRSKVLTVIDAMRRNRTDAALVRVLSPIIGSGESPERAAEQAVVRFVEAAFPLLTRHLPE